jgi:CRP/FNR family transcriptional regulator, cyclic AMP receptor protein
MEDLGQIIKEHPFFKDLKEEYLELVIGCATNVRFKSGEIIFKEGQAAEHFYLLREGLVAIETVTAGRRSITIQTIGAGEILGWSWLIPPHHTRFNSKVIQDVRAIAFDGKCLRGKCEKNHDLGYELLMRLAKVFAQRLEATRWQLLNMYGDETK